MYIILRICKLEVPIVINVSRTVRRHSSQNTDKEILYVVNESCGLFGKLLTVNFSQEALL